MSDTQLQAAQVLLADGWHRDVRITLRGGRIAALEPGLPGGEPVAVLLPAPANLHSHTFQRAMAGMTERRTAGQDSFWTWRDLMYRFLGHLTPGDVEAIAAMAMVEMAEGGFGSVAEFHYLHHGVVGVSHDDPAEMAGRIVAAADQTGMGLTLLPVLYMQGGCDGRALSGGQLRFGCDVKQFHKLLERSLGHVSTLPPDSLLGLAPHSLRAVPPAVLAEVADWTAGPVHLHLAEQEAEVEEVRAARGARPVEWAVANLPLSPRWCAVHCTRMTPAETAALAATGAVAGLCPITEANLGDGIFDGTGWRAAGGAWGVGTDSNVLISLTEELRLLEYSQRLRDRARAVLAEALRSTGRVLWEEAARGGARAAGRGTGGIAVGEWADLVALQAEGRHGDEVLDGAVFAGARIDRVWSAGRGIVREGRHIARDPVEARFRSVMAALRDRL